MRRYFSWFLVALWLPAAVMAQARMPVSLARTFRSGQVMRFQEVTHSRIGGAELSHTVTIKKEVKEIKPNGDIVLNTLIEGGHSKTPLGRGYSRWIARDGDLGQIRSLALLAPQC